MSIVSGLDLLMAPELVAVDSSQIRAFTSDIDERW